MCDLFLSYLIPTSYLMNCSAMTRLTRKTQRPTSIATLGFNTTRWAVPRRNDLQGRTRRGPVVATYRNKKNVRNRLADRVTLAPDTAEFAWRGRRRRGRPSGGRAVQDTPQQPEEVDTGRNQARACHTMADRSSRQPCNRTQTTSRLALRTKTSLTTSRPTTGRGRCKSGVMGASTQLHRKSA